MYNIGMVYVVGEDKPRVIKTPAGELQPVHFVNKTLHPVTVNDTISYIIIDKTLIVLDKLTPRQGYQPRVYPVQLNNDFSFTWGKVSILLQADAVIIQSITGASIGLTHEGIVTLRGQMVYLMSQRGHLTLNSPKINIGTT